MNLFRWLSGLLRPSAPSSREGRDGEDDGVGVLVPAGPRPLRGGAQAKPPVPVKERQDRPRR